MTKRSIRLFVEDIVESMGKVRRYTRDMDYDAFVQDERTVDAVIRNLEVIGEASKSIPSKVRAKYPGIPWKNMIGLRNITIHEYFGVDLTIIWEIITKNIPETEPKVKAILKDLRE